MAMGQKIRKPYQTLGFWGFHFSKGTKPGGIFGPKGYIATLASPRGLPSRTPRTPVPGDSVPGGRFGEGPSLEASEKRRWSCWDEILFDLSKVKTQKHSKKHLKNRWVPEKPTW